VRLVTLGSVSAYTSLSPELAKWPMTKAEWGVPSLWSLLATADSAVCRRRSLGLLAAHARRLPQDRTHQLHA
jgi:hypothetical protein